MHSNQRVRLGMTACVNTCMSACVCMNVYSHAHTRLEGKIHFGPVIFLNRCHLFIFKKSSGGYTSCVLQKEAGRISVQRTQTLESNKDLLNVFVGQDQKCVR